MFHLTVVQEQSENRHEATPAPDSATTTYGSLQWGKAAPHDQKSFERMLCAMGCDPVQNAGLVWTAFAVDRDNSSSRVGSIWSTLDNNLIFN